RCLVTDWMDENFAYLSGVFDYLIGMVGRDGVLVYSLRTESWRELNYQLEPSAAPDSLTEAARAGRRENLFALYVASNTLLDQNRIWSWKEFGLSAAEIARE